MRDYCNEKMKDWSMNVKRRCMVYFTPQDVCSGVFYIGNFYRIVHSFLCVVKRLTFAVCEYCIYNSIETT